MSSANYLKPSKQPFTDIVSEHSMTNLKANSIGARIPLAPLLLKGAGIDGLGTASIGALASVETNILAGNDGLKVADMSNAIMDFVNPPTIGGQPILTDLSQNIIYTDEYPTRVELQAVEAENNYLLYQDVDKVAELLTSDISSLFPAVPSLPPYSGSPNVATNEADFRNFCSTLPTGQVIELQTDLVLTTPVSITNNIAIRGDTPSRKITCSDTSTLIFNLGGFLNDLTVENTSASSVATCINVVYSGAAILVVDNCNILTNEFGIINNEEGLFVLNSNFSSVGTPDSQRYISLARVAPELTTARTVISNCNFEGNTTSNAVAVFMNGQTSNYQNGRLFIYDCSGGSLGNPLQRLGICETDLTGTNFELYLKNNNFTTSSGYFIFYSTNTLVGVRQLALLNNIETSVSPNSGKGLIGCDFVQPTTLGEPLLYADGNSPAPLRSDYPSYSVDSGVIAYKDSVYSPLTTLPNKFLYLTATQGGGVALDDLEMRDKKVIFNDGSVRIVGDVGLVRTSSRSITIGRIAGQLATGGNGVESVAIGPNAGNIEQGPSAVALGRTSGQSNQGEGAIAVGRSSGFTGQGINSVAVGRQAGATNQGTFASAIGSSAGEFNQGERCVAIGTDAGLNAQGFRCVAVGDNAGNFQQQERSVAVGNQAGFNLQGFQAVAIGNEAGNFQQGQNSVAIGANAGRISQHANTIVLNATGTEVSSDATGGFYVAPVREAQGGKIAQYNVSNNEISYSNALDYGNDDIEITGANIISASTGASSGNYLRIKLDGVFYKIELNADV